MNSKTELKILGFLGPKGTYSEQAGTSYMNNSQDSFTFVEKDSFMTLFNALQEKHCDEIVVPFENSIEGSVTTTLDLLIQTPDIFIKNEILVPISHCLLSTKKMSFQNITDVYSHPQPLAQCRNYLHRHLNHVHIHPTSSSAVQASQLKDGDAIVGPQSLSELYNLVVIDENINDFQNNVTRFVVLSYDQTQPTGYDRTSIAFSALKDQPGSLLSFLKEFSQRNINLTRISSRPTKVVLGDYLFFLDFYGHQDDLNIKDILTIFRQQTSYLRILGSYPLEKEILR